MGTKFDKVLKFRSKFLGLWVFRFSIWVYRFFVFFFFGWLYDLDFWVDVGVDLVGFMLIWWFNAQICGLFMV